MTRLVLLVALLASACIRQTPPVVTPPAPTDRFVHIRVVGADGRTPTEIGGTLVRFDAQPAVTCETLPEGIMLSCLMPPDLGYGALFTGHFTGTGYGELVTVIEAQPDVNIPGLPLLMPPPPSMRELMEAPYTFQGLRANCPQYDPRPLPIFDPMLDVVDAACRQSILDAHRAAGDRVIGVALSHQYAEPGVIPILQAGRDWTNDLPGLHAFLVDLIRQGWFIQLHLAGDGHSVCASRADYLFHDANQYLFTCREGRYVYNDPIGHTYGCEWLNETWPRIADALEDIRHYIRFLPGYDGVFYGCETPAGDVIEIPKFARQFKQRWPDGVLGIEFNIGHLPFGEGDTDWQPGGRMQDFNMVFAEFDGHLDQDSTWQIVARLMKAKGDYHRPPEQPTGDDPDPPAYLGKWPGIAVCFEWDTYDDVRFRTTPQSVAVKRAKLRAMGCAFVG